jgi:hypothetical protein
MLIELPKVTALQDYQLFVLQDAFVETAHMYKIVLYHFL